MLSFPAVRYGEHMEPTYGGAWDNAMWYRQRTEGKKIFTELEWARGLWICKQTRRDLVRYLHRD
jgi:hypothetical protein